MRIEDFIQTHIRANVTALVAALSAASSTPQRDYPAATLVIRAFELSAPFLDYEGYEEALHKGHTDRGIPPIGYYIVTSELADKLEARGERVERDFGGVIVWARKAFHRNVTCLDLDPVLLAIFEAEPQTILSSTYETLEQFNARREKRRAGQ